jgi:hypothetical protein
MLTHGKEDGEQKEDLQRCLKVRHQKIEEVQHAVRLSNGTKCLSNVCQITLLFVFPGATHQSKRWEYNLENAVEQNKKRKRS